MALSTDLLPPWLTTEPLPPWHIVVALLATGVAALLLGRGAFDRWRVLGRGPRTRLAVLFLSLIAAILFAVASLDPRYTRISEPGSVHLAVAVDVSDSVLRADGGWPQVHNQAHELIEASIAAMPQVRIQGTASIVTFGTGVAVARRKIPLADLPAAFNRLDRSNFAVGDDSDIAAGLARAGELVERAGGQGAILLISDGHQTVGDAFAEAERLARRGIVIHVHPVESRGPELAITAADLPRNVNAEAETFVRGVLTNGASSEVKATLTFSQNPGIENPSNQVGMTIDSILIPGGDWAPFRQPIQFQGLGLQFVELFLAPDDGAEQHQRRFFTHVYRPPKILAIGGDNRWTAALPPDLATITPIIPSDLSADVNLKDFDAIVISSVPANQFPAGSLAAVAEAVEQDSLGLMIMNGDHHGANDEMQTILMSYKDTVLEPLLPVSGDPRAFLIEPPSRQVIILIDASGSMGGWQIEKSKEIARYIVQDLLRPRDRLDLIGFTVGAQPLIKDQFMDDEGKREATNRIDSIAASGGTDPSKALALVADRKMINCGLVFISDGKFDRVAYRPDCRATVFAIGHQSVSEHSPLRELADPFPVGPLFDPRDIEIPYFNPERREKFFEPGSFIPLTMERFSRKGDRLPVPEMPLQGTAVTYVKEDADLIAVRPKLTDPVLAYRKSGTGHVGVLTTAVPPSWLESEEGRQAVKAWVTWVVPYRARDRYDFRLTDQGDVIEIQISLVAKEGKVPAVKDLTAHIEVQGQAPIHVPLGKDPIAPATFNGHIRISRDTRAQSATLILSESGPDALSHPQRVPILIPQAGTGKTSLSRETHSYGLNKQLLQAIAQAGGGTYFETPNGTPIFRGKKAESRAQPLWPLLLVAAIVCYLVAIALRRLDL